jgi:hypothetical protein
MSVRVSLVDLVHRVCLVFLVQVTKPTSPASRHSRSSRHYSTSLFTFSLLANALEIQAFINLIS